MKIWLSVLAGIVLAIVGFGYWALKPQSTSGEVVAPFNLAEIRQLAGDETQTFPHSIGQIKTGAVLLPDALVRSGGTFSTAVLEVYSYKINYTEDYVLLDVGSDEATLAGIAPRYKFYADGFANVQAALPSAKAIVITHEHYDHCAGIAFSPYFNAIADAVRLTPAQLANQRSSMCQLTADQRLKLKPLEYDQYFKLAPGIVLISAAGHTPGSQMVYVQLQNGKELLFVGDIAWHFDNVALSMPHPRLTNWLVQEDSKAMAAQLTWLNQVHVSFPDLTIVPGHDSGKIDQLISAGILQSTY